MATGFPVKANYATGDVLTAANMNDLSGTLNTIQYLTPRNAVLNSNFSVWQRGTSFTAASVYTADRWYSDSQTYRTMSRQATGDTTNLPNIQYCARVQRNSGQTGTSQIGIAYTSETITSIPYSGKTVTLSFYARAGANYSSASNALGVYMASGTGTDQNRSFSAAFTGEASVINSSATLTTTWQRFTFTGTIPTNSTEWGFQFYYNPVGTAGANDYFEITGVQLELGSTANTYMPNQPTYQGELAACQRYYWRTSAGSAYSRYAPTSATSATNSIASIPLPVIFRVAPTSVDYSNLLLDDGAGGSAAVTSLILTGATGDASRGNITIGVASGLTTYRTYFLENNNNTAGYIGFNAEL